MAGVNKRARSMHRRIMPDVEKLAKNVSMTVVAVVENQGNAYILKFINALVDVGKLPRNAALIPVLRYVDVQKSIILYVELTGELIQMLAFWVVKM